MTKKTPTDNPHPVKTLRERAEVLLKTSHADIAAMSNEEVRKLVHELQVHQMELDIQNEDLREAQIELARSRDRYSDLYEFAPVGYLLLDRQGLIQEANLTAATMLGVERNRLNNRKLTDFLSDEAQDAWHLHRRETFSEEVKKSCELAMNPVQGNLLTVRLESLAFRDEDGNLSECRTALIDVTTVKLARQQLEQSEQRYHRLTDAMVDYIFRIRVEKGGETETTHGPNCEAVTGYTPADFAANKLLWISIVPAEDRSAVEHHIRRTLAGENPAPLEHRIHRKDGSVRWVLRVASTQFDDQGRVIACDGLLRDITKRKVAEEALQQLNETLEQRVAEQTSEIQLLAMAISNLGEGVLITSDHLEWPGPHIVFVNEAMSRITGYAKDELIGQSPRILQGDKSDRETLDRIKTELAFNHTVLAELVNYRKDGTPYDAEVFITPLFESSRTRQSLADQGLASSATEPERRRTNFVSIHRDITERKRAERALQDREERLRAILDTASDAVINIDHRGIISTVNPATESMFGYTQDELVGQNVKILMPAPYSNEHDGYIARYLATGEARIIGIGREVTCRRKDGSMFPAGLAISNVNHFDLFTGIIRDISERIKLQRDVLQIAEDEQRRIGQDLHDSTQQELTGLGMLAQTLLDKLSKDSPDLPKPRGPDACELAKKILDGIVRAHREVQTISRRIVPVSLNAQGLIDALRELASRTDDLEGVTCAFKCEQPVDVADNLTATHLYRITQEAITNALKHGRSEHILIALDSDDGYPILQIADDGRGFDSTKKNDGMGLKTMLYRATLIGAHLTVSPVEAGGTLVNCKVFGGGGVVCDD